MTLSLPGLAGGLVIPYFTKMWLPSLVLFIFHFFVIWWCQKSKGVIHLFIDQKMIFSGSKNFPAIKKIILSQSEKLISSNLKKNSRHLKKYIFSQSKKLFSRNLKIIFSWSEFVLQTEKLFSHELKNYFLANWKIIFSRSEKWFSNCGRIFLVPEKSFFGTFPPRNHSLGHFGSLTFAGLLLGSFHQYV